MNSELFLFELNLPLYPLLLERREGRIRRGGEAPFKLPFKKVLL